ncbi:MAG: mechanosensitive ion channel family protein [Xanthobacteraceae bacterium]
MIERFGELARAFLAVIFLGVAGAAAQSVQPPASPPTDHAQPAPQAVAAQIDTIEITARANRDVGQDIQAAAKGWQGKLDRLEGEIQKQRLRYSELNNLRDEVQRIRATIAEFSSHLDPPLTAGKAQVELLGPAPAAGQPAEPEQAARSRAELNYYFGLLTAGQAAVQSANLRIDNIINAIQDIRRKNFATNLFQPVPGIYAQQTWARLPDSIPATMGRVRDLLTEWWDNVSAQEDIALTGVEAILIWLALTVAAFWGVRRLRYWPHEEEPPFWRRASTAAGVIVLRAAPVIAPVVFLYALIADVHALSKRVDWMFYSGVQSIVIIAAVTALVFTVLAPKAARWRLIPASDLAAARICSLVLTLTLVYGVSSVFYVVTRLVQAPFSLTVAVAFPATLLLAAIVIAILLTPLDGKPREGMPSLRYLTALRVPVGLTVAAIIISALAGYLALSRFLAQQLVVTGSILAFVYLLLLWVDGFTQSLSDDSAKMGHRLKELGLEQRRREQLTLPIGLLLKFSVLVLSVPLILLQWGYNAADIYDWYQQLFFGFHIGNTQVSFAVLLASVIVFALAYAAARLFQGWLDSRVLKPAGLSGGLRDSIRIGVGYVGIVIAALAALSYAGFGLSNLAIVAGAFSVGIGFGLQSVVNNFVSGLILLAERPIKLGDLVVVGGEEGYVRKISVRSTEIETADRARVVVPNSYLITEKVKNWTLRDNIRRIVIPVGVAYGSDPRSVRAILLKLAQEHPNVMRSPAPAVELEDFGADSLNFKLCAFVYDLTTAAGTSTDLRIAVLDAFKDAGIAIPFRQTEITVRDMEGLRQAVGASAAHANGAAGVNGKTAHRAAEHARADRLPIGSAAM